MGPWGTVAGVVGAHLVGCFPSARLVGRRAGFDPTAAGSGNPGATNVYRLGGRRAGATVLALDALKGAVPAALGVAVGGRGGGLLLGAAAVSGHIAPVTQGFRGGGKGVATAAGMTVVVDPRLALAGAAVFGVVGGATRRASAASLAAAVAVPVGAVVVGRPPGEIAGWTALAVVVVLRHAGNIRRLVTGAEPATTARSG